MFGFSYSPANQPGQAHTWLSSPPGHSAVQSWQPPTDSHWWNQPQPSAPAWARPTTHIQIWGEHPVQWMHPGAGFYPPIQPLAIMAHTNQQLLQQQQGHYTQPLPCPAQPKELDLVLKGIEQATDRIAQLETAAKAQQEEAKQGTAAIKQYVSEQMADWRTWKESEEPQPTRKHNKPELAHDPTHHSGPTEPETALQAPVKVPGQPLIGEGQTFSGTLESEAKPRMRQILNVPEPQLWSQDSSTKRRRSPSEEDSHPPKRAIKSHRAFSQYSHSQKSLTNKDSKQSKPILPQKNKAQPTQPPWRTPPTVEYSTRRRQPPISESARPPYKPTGQEIALHSPSSPIEDEAPGQLPPLAEIDGKAINREFPPFATTPTWEPTQFQTGSDGSRRHSSWSQLWRCKIPKGTQLRVARSPFSATWCDHWFNSLQALDWERPHIKGKKLNRRTAWFVRGECTCTYDYGSMHIAPRYFPVWLDDLMEVVMPECGLVDKLSWPTSCNVNYYERHDDMVGAHADNEALFQGNQQEITIISLSLGGTRDFLVYEAKQVLGTITLRNGDLIAMERWTQAHLKHGIAKLPQGSLEEPRRINLTWRWIAQHKRDCAAEYQHMVISPASLPVPDNQMAADEAERSYSFTPA